VRVVVVSGIWPPDVGGPASHAPALADALLAAGHEVEVVTTADAEPAARPYPVRWVSRSRPAPLRHLAVAHEVRRAARRADRVYATTMVRRATIGATLARRPLVVKLVADEAYERERRTGRFDGTLEEFQQRGGGVRRRALRATRTAALRRARAVVVPSEYLREIALGWGLDPSRVTVIPNPAPELPPLPSRDDARAALGIGGFALGTAGRLTGQKALGDALDAVARVPGVDLLVLGDGPERAALERHAARLGLGDRVRFLGAGSRADVLTLFRAVDAALLTSAWENLPHTLLEALAVGTPVVATAVGGIPEVVTDGGNGLLVPPRDVEAIAAAVERLAEDDALRGALAQAARASVEELAEPRILQRIVQAIVGDGGGSA
jgi:glycosyltransferase involved in cell wall biosynthesis